jgi:Na+-transporting NADH:ubiquinone oxidoreductase subunit NqrC
LNFLRTLPKEKLKMIVLIVVVTLIAIVIIGHFYVARELAASSESNRQIAKLKQQVEEADRASQQELQNKQLRETATAFVGVQEATMVTGDPFSWVVRQISLLAEQHPVHVMSMHPGGNVQHDQGSHYSMYTTQIDVEGTYDQVGAFIEDFENKFPTGQIRSLTLVPSGANGSARRATIDLGFLIQPERDGMSKPAGKAKEESKKAS